MENVFFKSAESLKAKRDIIIKGGRDMLKIISDFDMTLTRFKLSDGSRGVTSYGVLEDPRFVSSETLAAADALRAKYFPIERSTEVSREQKMAAMLEWWQGAHDNLVRERITLETLHRAVDSANTELREGATEVFRECDAKGIPIFIFSAGLGNVVHALLDRKFSCWNDSLMHLFSNMIEFNEPGGVISGFKREIVHTMNKNEVAMIEALGAEKVCMERRNVVLLGDNITDKSMADDQNHECVLRVGFLNHDVERDLEAFLVAFDVVVCGDAGTDWVLALLREIQ